MEHLRQTLEITLVVSLDNYTGQVTTNKATSQLTAFSTELFHEKATSETAEQIDFNPSVTPQVLTELIQKIHGYCSIFSYKRDAKP